MRGITKRFVGVTALSDVTFSVTRGEIHAVVGENGAGKSTLMKVLSGVYGHGSYDGEIIYEGESQKFRSLAESEKVGIVIIHQELALVPLLSISENIFLGNEQSSRGVIDWNATHKRTAELLARVGLSENPRTRVGDLGLGKQQLVEIAKALAKDVKLLILDEPTSSLNEADSAALLDLLLEFKAKGISSILISHKLNEIEKVADTVTIIRDGEVVSTLAAHGGEVTEERVIRDMVGRDLSDRFPQRDLDRPLGEVLFEVRNWTVHDPAHPERRAVDDVSLNVRAGEIVGISGLMGAGRTELAMSLFGGTYGRNISGEAFIGGERLDTSSVHRVVDAGLAYVTEDRKQYGLVLDDSIQRNIPLARLEGVSDNGIISDARELAVAREYRDKLKIKSSSVRQAAVNLSGGNQQKVVLSKWLFTEPKVLILDEPTRGIDVGAKFEIYTIIHQLAAEGRAVIVITSELPEILGVCDRVYVMNEGRFVGELPIREASQEKIMQMIIRASR
ncbi:sugar ABC transporter ATP-binding protein [Acuticoccus sp. MNP-M23]|uniref:multiple monosaccharide ABC transporter ATP-binding protein n=1 Tax=Acuticoccus sp. MNP-M23 TaxID=3072793 RepID=UPI002814D307|nr:multiple monosaccharide ABC transporter ATP-binding protein [Acuticoccus sp. MNP-M23]WMS45131.1 sugar ABC transporter ATP-binding protein [Acuticoccus sp. MNP-M23]